MKLDPYVLSNKFSLGDLYKINFLYMDVLVFGAMINSEEGRFDKIHLANRLLKVVVVYFGYLDLFWCLISIFSLVLTVKLPLISGTEAEILYLVI